MFTRLSESPFFARNRDYYGSAGLEAWGSEAIPSYATSHAGVASAYAAVIRAAVLDLDEPVTVLELGSGSGRLGFFLAVELEDLLDSGAVTLILSDQSEKLVTALSQHPAFGRFSGRVCFRQVDARSLVDLAPGAPLVVIANYLFDSLPQDVYERRAGEVHEVHVADFGTPEGRVQSVERRSYEWPEVEAVLQCRLEALGSDGFYLFPVCALDVARAAAAHRGHTILLVSDKGWVSDEAVDRAPPRLATHEDAFSLMVDFGALATWAERRGGWAAVPGRRPEPLSSCAFVVSGAPLREVRRVSEAVFVRSSPFDAVYGLGPASRAADLTIEEALATVRRACWDPMAFLRTSHALERVRDITPDQRAAIEEMLEVLRERLYPLPGGPDLASLLARVWFALGEVGRADTLLQQSLDWTGERAETHRGRATCAMTLGDLSEARAHLERARALDPFDSATSEAWMRLQRMKGSEC